MRRLVLIAVGLLVAALVVDDGALATALGAAALVTAGIAWFEAGTDSTRELALVGTLAAAAAAGRVLFTAIPGVQPVTVIAIVAGAALGMRAGVATGALAAFVSNFFLGQGIWTPQQMLGWGACGAVGALLAPMLRNRWVLAGRRGGARLRLQRDDGRLALVRLRAAHAVRARGGRRPRPVVRRCARGRQRRDRARRRSRAAAHARPVRLAAADGGRVGVAALVSAALLAATSPVAFVQSHGANGGFSESGGTTDALLTSWAVLGLRAAGAPRSGVARLPQVTGGESHRDHRRRARRARGGGARRPQRDAAREARAARERPDRADAQLDVLGGARARALVAGDDALHPRPPGEERRLRVGGRRAARLERHRGRARGVEGRARARRFRHAGRSLPARRSRTATAASSSRAAAAPTRSRRRGRSRVSSPPACAAADRVRLPREAQAAPTAATATPRRYAATPVWVTSQVLAALAKKPFPLRHE